MSISDDQHKQDALETVYLELSDGQSHKFYEVTVDGLEVTIRYGRIDTQGQTSRSSYASLDIAQATATQKVKEKLKKSYVRSPLNPLPSATVASVDSPTSYLTTFVMENDDLSRLEIPLRRSLAAVEIIAICHSPAFTVNLVTDKDIAYHFDSRPYQGQIVQNTCVSGWGLEERLAIPNGFAAGKQFKLRIAVETDIVVYLNDRVLCRYVHRLLPTQIGTVQFVYAQKSLQVQSVKVFEPESTQTLGQKLDAAISRPEPRPNSSLSTTLLPEIVTPEIVTPEIVTPEIVMTEIVMTEEHRNIPQFLHDLPPQFEPLRSLLTTNSLPYIKITEEAVGNLNSDLTGDPLELWQSKIGGHPYLPKGTSYPVDRETGEMMMFLMQVNCADLPQVDGLPLPQRGILQFYVGLDVSMCELSPEKHRVIYFPEVSQDKSNLVVDFSFTASIRDSHEWYEEIYALEFSAQQDLFWEDRYFARQLNIPADLMQLCDEFVSWISEYDVSWISEYDDEHKTASLDNKLGGYIYLDSCEVDIEGVKGRLLLELQHEFNSDDHFYFFIEESDLVALDFDNVGSCFWRM